MNLIIEHFIIYLFIIILALIIEFELCCGGSGAVDDHWDQNNPKTFSIIV